MTDLARVQKLHEAAIAAGLPGVLPDRYGILSDIYGQRLILGEWHDHMACPGGAAQAAVAWWLHDWFLRVSNAGPLDANDILRWAEGIVATLAKLDAQCARHIGGEDAQCYETHVS